MGLLLSCPVEELDVADAFESLLVRSLSIDGEKTPLGRSRSYRKCKIDAVTAKPLICTAGPIIADDSSIKQPAETESPKHEEAAVKLQKVYKSFRTRRQLADCAVLAEQRWWRLLDFAVLKVSSVSFFDVEKPESAVSRWARARTRAAKVGKGLSKNEKARKLALQHWLEAIDPRHRYGHNLHYYYDCWIRCESRQPFFYWLDVGEGKEVNLDEQCPRSKLQQQCIKYLGPNEREAYEVVVEDGRFVYKQNRQVVLHTAAGSKPGKWIFVLSTSKKMYVGQKQKGTFQHSSFLAGGATSAAGRLVVEKGALKAVWPHSGHYRPTEENFQEFVSFLKENNVDLTHVKLDPEEDEEEFGRLRSSVSHREIAGDRADGNGTPYEAPKGLLGDDGDLFETRSEEDEFEDASTDSWEAAPANDTAVAASDEDGRTVVDGNNSDEKLMFCKRNLFEEEDRSEEEPPPVPEEQILRRINSRKDRISYQLGKQLALKWSTGAGPRIVCVRDYPSELQFRSLEQMNLSPRSESASSPAMR